MEGRFGVFFKGLQRGLGLGLGTGLGGLCVVGGVLLAQSLNTFNAGDLISASALNANFSTLDNRITALDQVMAPVGSIVAFHKHAQNPGVAANPLSIPAGWVECNGGSVSDSDSPIDGFAIPDLNGAGRFLRGSGTSGTPQTDAFQGHRHAMEKDSNILEWHNIAPSGSFYKPAGTADTFRGGTSTGYRALDPTTGVHGTVRVDSETRPTNLSVVWIMRIK